MTFLLGVLVGYSFREFVPLSFSALHDLNVRFHHNRGHESRIQPQSETEIRFFFRRFLNLKGYWRIDREYQVMARNKTKSTCETEQLRIYSQPISFTN